MIYLIYLKLLFIYLNSFTDPLPVELLYKYLIVDTNLISVKWGTATELNNFGFFIENSSDSLNWTERGFIEGNGTSFSPHHYTFDDSSANPDDFLHYRIKQLDTDFNSKIYYVGTTDDFRVSVKPYYSEIDNFYVSENFPNPFNPSTTLVIKVPESSDVSIGVYNILGEQIDKIIINNISAGFSEIKLNLEEYPSGVYFAKIFYKRLTKTIKLNLIK